MRRYSPFRLSAIFLLGAAALLVIAGAPQLDDQSFDLPASVWLTFAYAVIGPLVITNLLWFTAIDWVGPSRALRKPPAVPRGGDRALLLHESLTRLQAGRRPPDRGRHRLLAEERAGRSPAIG